jgi:Flp pilus assembly pilin Flp
MSNIMMLPKRFLQDDEGATLLEYGMLTLLITVLSIVAVQSIGTKVSAGFKSVDSQLPAAP